MCLIGDEGRKKAKKDIKCYKVLRKEQNAYTTPFCFTSIEKDILKGKRPFIAEGEEIIETEEKNIIKIHGGFIHSFSDLRRAFQVARWNGCKVFKCVIPKDTDFYPGWVSDYASSEIRFVRPCRLINFILSVYSYFNKILCA